MESYTSLTESQLDLVATGSAVPIVLECGAQGRHLIPRCISLGSQSELSLGTRHLNGRGARCMPGQVMHLFLPRAACQRWGELDHIVRSRHRNDYGGRGCHRRSFHRRRKTQSIHRTCEEGYRKGCNHDHDACRMTFQPRFRIRRQRVTQKILICGTKSYFQIVTSCRSALKSYVLAS